MREFVGRVDEPQDFAGGVGSLDQRNRELESRVVVHEHEEVLKMPHLSSDERARYVGVDEPPRPAFRVTILLVCVPWSVGRHAVATRSLTPRFGEIVWGVGSECR